MGSTYLKGVGLGSGRCGSSSSRKAKKKEKSKQPQRGLGVAQLEQMRLQSQMEEYVSSLNSPFCSDLNMPEDSRVEMAVSSPPSSPSGIVSGPSFALHPPDDVMMDHHGDAGRTSLTHGERWLGTSARSHLSEEGMPSSLCYSPPTVTLPLFEETTAEDSAQKNRRHDQNLSTSSINQNSDPDDAREVDLELRLWL
ncbi:hypothetical protein OPV22_015826 [Ensete ventricosum]|uniref:Uncharacterized protein n=1 Tax=Ensete ventricosum TaxID=4639 RepID=A0AAV8RAS0_ENSVE|nr:hypothetical protein OPV22_015826 [Ensete ventricosum]